MQVAGAAALIRDYFALGFAPGGVAGSGPPRTISGVLVKALLINGAADMDGLDETGLPLEPTPSRRQGWGRVDLRTALPLADASPASIALLVVDVEEAAVSEGQTAEWCLQMPSGLAPLPDISVGHISPALSAAETNRQQELIGSSFIEILQVTLAWYDPPPAAPAPEARDLLNDLDLHLYPPPGAPLPDWGVADRPDRTNTVERGLLRRPSPGAAYRVAVAGQQVVWGPEGPTGAQPFALAVSAPRGATLCRCGLECDCGSCGPAAAPAPAPKSSRRLGPATESAAPVPPDPCACSSDGKDRSTGASSGRIGCVSLRDGRAYCQVVDGYRCPTALASLDAPGTAWLPCGTPEPVASSSAAIAAAGDPCDCSMDGESGGVQTGRRGCRAFLAAVLQPAYSYCYVIAPAHCPSATPSIAWPGAAFRPC